MFDLSGYVRQKIPAKTTTNVDSEVNLFRTWRIDLAARERVDDSEALWDERACVHVELVAAAFIRELLSYRNVLCSRTW